MRTIQVANVAIAMLIAAGFVIPRLVRVGEGFAAAATAVLIVLGCLTASAVVAVWLAAWTHRHRADLTAPAKWLGYGPAAFVLAALFALVALLRY